MRSLAFIILIIPCISSFAKDELKIEHLEGTEDINGVKVKVSSEGQTAVDNGYCKSTSPYYIGRNHPGEGDGSFIFEFSPAVSHVRLDFSAMSHAESSYKEIVIVRVNGRQYQIPKGGTENGCEPLAVVTDEGYIEPCSNCSGSGIADIIIDGPINTLEVKDSVIYGSPEGTLFSIYMGKSMPMGPELISVRAVRVLNIIDDPNHVKAIGVPDGGTRLTVYNANGKLLRNMSQGIRNHQLIDVSDLPNGYYVFVLQGENFREERSVVLSGN
jgi:hypothetical protein